MKKYERCKWVLCLCLSLLLVVSLVACKETDEQSSAQPTPSTQPTPTPTPPIAFYDVAHEYPYYDAVVWAYENGIASDGETFGPADACTRGQVMTFLWRAKGSPEPQAEESPFSDVSSDDWFYKPALWASENGIATGTAFNPGNPCTSAEALTFLWRAEGKPAASMYNSAVALAASGQYYARPAAWAETNGLFAGTDFDPAAPCSRAGLMAYLHWATEEWTFAEEDKAVQAEYEQIINDARLYEVHGSGLCYADYEDVDSDGKVELLTVGISGDTVTAAVYANIGGHAEKSCEKAFGTYGGDNFSLYRLDSQLYLCQNVFSGNAGETYDFCRIEKGAITFCEQASIFYRWETPEADTAILEKYKEEKGLFRIDYSEVSVLDRGLLPTVEEYEAALAQRWANHWAEIDPAYAAVLKGDFSAFAGRYADISGLTGDIALGIDGAVTGDYITNQKPVSVTVCEDGTIYCTVKWYEEEMPDGGIRRASERYIIYPVGIADDGDPNTGYQGDPSKVRIEYWWPSHGVDMAIYSRIS